MRSADQTARIELPPEQIQTFVNTVDLGALVARFQELGFLYVTLDLEGFASGKLNRVLAPSASHNA